VGDAAAAGKLTIARECRLAAFFPCLPHLRTSTNTRLPTQATYLTFSQPEQQAIADAKRRGAGMRAVVDSPLVGRWGGELGRGPACGHKRSAGVEPLALVPYVPPPTPTQGQRMHPELRKLLLSGSVALRVPRASDLPLGFSLFGRSSV
jgi:hypothetical protein